MLFFKDGQTFVKNLATFYLSARAFDVVRNSTELFRRPLELAFGPSSSEKLAKARSRSQTETARKRERHRCGGGGRRRRLAYIHSNVLPKLVGQFLANFARPVLGCIEADLRK